MTKTQRFFPWAVMVLVGLYLLSWFRPAEDDGPYHLQQLGRIPVSGDGRVKPLDTVARNSLMIISGRQTLRINGRVEPAIRWLADAIAQPALAKHYEVFRIDHPDVLALMGLSNEDGKRFSFATIMQHQREIWLQAQKASQVPTKERDSFQKHVLELFNHVNLYISLFQRQKPYMIPPLLPGEEWRPMSDLIHEGHPSGGRHQAVTHLGAIFSAYHEGRPTLFNQEVSRYRQLLASNLPVETRKANFEVLFNGIEPFIQAGVLYVIAFLTASLSFLLRCLSNQGWSRALGRATVGLLIVAWVVHTVGLGSRIYLQGRPPVTNLYSSAVFIGWGCVAMALVLEGLFRLGLGSISAACVGFVTLVIAHHLGGEGDTMQMMQAVLDSNFWLATHVVAVTIGYSATFLAGFLAILFILLGVFTPVLRGELFKAFGKMVYGVICFAMLFSFVGTVLGGIWADQSWGRFWGWDPKENGAVLIVLMNALILHARWGGLIRERGMAVLAVGGNIITCWSWFGTNMLGVGLHSYGFMESAVFWMLVFVASQLTIMALGMLPMTWWSSFKTTAEMGAKESKPPEATGRIRATPIG